MALETERRRATVRGEALNSLWTVNGGASGPPGHVVPPASFRTAFALETIPEGCFYSTVHYDTVTLQNCFEPGLGIETH